MKKQDNTLKLSAPWHERKQMVKAFLKGDDRFEVKIDDSKDMTIAAKTEDLGNALKAVLIPTFKDGNVKQNVVIVTMNATAAKKGKKGVKGKCWEPLAALKEVLKKNPAFLKLRTARIGDRAFTQCIFKPVVMSWYADNIGNPWKTNSSIHEFVASAIFNRDVHVVWATKPVDAK